MEVLTRKHDLLAVSVEKKEASLLRSNLSFYKKTGTFTAYGTQNYVEITTDKTVFLSLREKLRDIHVILEKEKSLVFLVGDRTVECFEGEISRGELELSSPILCVQVHRNALLILTKNILKVYNKNLKKIQDISLPLKFPESFSILEVGSESVLAVLSRSERTCVLLSGGKVVKTLSVASGSYCVCVFPGNNGPFCAITVKNAIRVVGVFSEFDSTAESDHIGRIESVRYSEGLLYTASREGVICTMKPGDSEACAIYVESQGISSVGLE
ncbi:uncharacterized protein NEMAJ01_0795 [Nematocida major]|uniref:uncharacterized protein n=1 Tax=Nematocida major TaxID=1912982 RepID=UPI002008559D|nr:uncharacterized protein NEMAJ01_0795 [Nematocida major]KAH9385899.1 hypothetical protein NEMAJ01_0795 [Nematocida major]